METGWDQMVAVALLTIAAAVGIGILMLALSLVRALIMVDCRSRCFKRRCSA